MYVVPGVPLIPQQKSMACWYASAQMLIQWKRAQTLSTRSGHPDPSEVPYAVKREATNQGIPYSHALKLARMLGLLPIMPTSVSLEGFQRLLLAHGPLWTHGQRHIVVIAGVNQESKELFVHDPLPPAFGNKSWRSLADWFVSGDSPSTRATSPGLQVSFLYHP
jgi:hypothetical protein